MEENKKGSRKTRIGVVISDKMDKTVTVLVEQIVQHRKYRKYVRRRKKIKAHDPRNMCRDGDRVLVEETRPLSKTKHWRVVKILNREATRDDVGLKEVQDVQG